MDSYIGQINLFTYAALPKGWVFCNGQTLPIAQNQALYSLLGASFGTLTATTFTLPDLRSRTMISQGRSPDGIFYNMGNQAGAESVTLALATVPPHQHLVTADATTASTISPADSFWAKPIASLTAPTAENLYGPAPSNPVPLNPAAVNSVGGSQAHDNRQPYLALGYAICISGVYPTRS